MAHFGEESHRNHLQNPSGNKFLDELERVFKLR